MKNPKFINKRKLKKIFKNQYTEIVKNWRVYHGCPYNQIKIGNVYYKKSKNKYYVILLIYYKSKPDDEKLFFPWTIEI